MSDLALKESDEENTSALDSPSTTPPFVFVNLSESKSEQTGNSSTSGPVLLENNGVGLVPVNTSTSVTTQKFLRYALRSFDDEKAVYDIVGIRTETTTVVQYVTMTEQTLHSEQIPLSDVVDQASGDDADASKTFELDGQRYPVSICVPIHPDVAEDLHTNEHTESA